MPLERLNSLAARTIGAAQRMTGSFAKGTRGNVSFIFGMAAATLVVAGGGAVDYASMVAVRSNLQSAADAAATAAARELYLANAKDSDVQAVAKQMAGAKLATNSGIETYAVAATVGNRRTAVTATITAEPKVFFASLVGVSSKTLTVDATARIMGSGRICAIGLDPASVGAIRLEKSAKITARNCSVFSNSSHSQGLKAHNSSRLTAEFTCTAGGYQGTASNFAPLPETDCPPIPDPLAQRTPPSVGACTKSKMTIDSGLVTLSPGVYCNGLKITKTAKVRLKPGIYIIKDGPLVVDKEAEFTGEYVGFYFTGDKATFKFTKDSLIKLGAPKSGPLAGLLFFGDRGNALGKKYRIESNNARHLLGTIYLPNGDLEIEAKRPIADQSDYTVVVSYGIKMGDGPDLVLNANYDASDIPVPDGVGPVGGNIVLTE